MTNVFRPMKLPVPGLLGDDALAQQLDIFSKQQRDTQAAAPAPNSAVDFADSIKKRFLDEGYVHQQGGIPRKPAATQLFDTPAARFADQERRIDEGGSSLAQGINSALRFSPAGYFASELVKEGTLSAEEAAAANAANLEDLKLREQAFQNKADIRAKLRGLSDAQATEMGLPVAPGGTPSEAQQEGAELDQRTLQSVQERKQEAEKAVAGEVKGLTQEWWLNAMQVGARSAALTGTSVLQYPLAWYEMQAGYVRGNAERSEARVWLETVDNAITKMLPGDKTRSKEFLTELSSGSGSMAAFLLAGYISAAAGLPAALGSGGLGAASSGMQAYKEAEQASATGVQKFLSLVVGSGLGMTEAVPIDHMLFRADAHYGGLVRRMLVNTAAGSIEEFVQELSQAVGEDVNAKFIAGYDPQRKLDVKEWIKQGAIGGLVGGGAGAVTTGLGAIGVEAGPTAAQREQATMAVIEMRQRDIDKALAGVPAELSEPMQPDLPDIAMPEGVPPGAIAEVPPETPLAMPEDAPVELQIAPGVTVQPAPAIETPEFKQWFGDSKTINKDGSPKVLYHGTGRDFTTFDTSYGNDGEQVVFLTADAKQAGKFADMAADRQQGEPVVMPLFARMENPFIADKRTAKDYGYDGTYERNTFGSIIDAAKEAGHDSIIFRKVSDAGIVADQYAVFSPTQLKSVNNRGTFDPTDPDILAQRGTTAANRNAFKAEQTRPAAGIPLPAGAAPAEVSLAAIASNVVKTLDLTARQGRMTLKGSDVMGQYSRKQAVVRLRTWNDLSSLVHEGGHALHDAASAELQTFERAHETELKKVADDLYGGNTTQLNNAQHIREGFAEFFRVFVLNRSFAATQYPAVTTAFETELRRFSPQMLTALDGIGDQFAAWLQMPSAQLINSMVVPGRRGTKLDEAIKELREAGFKSWYEEVARKTIEVTTNQFAPLNAVVNDLLNNAQRNAGKALDLKIADDPRKIARMARNSGARAMVQLTDGVMPYRSVQPSTRGLREALMVSQGVPEGQSPRRIDEARAQEFDSYLVALRARDEYRRLDEGKIDRPPINATLGDVDQAIADLEAKYGPSFIDAAAIVHEFGMGLWQKQYDAGLMDRETYTEGLDRQFYVPLQRDMSDKKASLGASALTAGASIVKRFRGSDRSIVSPMSVLMHKTFALEQIIAQNDVKKALALLADKAGASGALVERVPATALIGKQYSIKEVAKQLTNDDDITAADAADLMTILQASMDNDNVLSFFRAETASAKGENVTFFWEAGKLQAIQVVDGDLGSDLINLMDGVGRENFQIGIELLTMTTTAFRTAITSWPDFLVVNYIRDQLSAWVLTDVGFKPFASGIRGVADELRQNQWSKMYNASMGIMGGMNVATLHEARVRRDIDALRGKGYLAQAFNERGVLGAVKGMANVVELTETGTRLGLFRNAYERGKADGLTDWEAATEAAYIATDYIDFGLNGNRMLFARRTIPFLNAQLQGLYKMMRTLGGDEVRQRKGLRFVLGAYFKSTQNLDLSRTEKAAINTGRKAWVKMVSLGLLSAALHFIYEDDPDYQEASEYLRVTGWVIPIGDGRIVYVPKPFELAMIANATERALESAAGDAEAKNRFMRGLAMTLTPPTSPPAIQIAVEQVANYDFFGAREIVPDNMRALSPALQYSNYTSELAKSLGDITGWSPMRIDHFLSGIGASAYRDVVTMTNALDPNRPTMDATDAPILRRFVRDVRRGSTSAQDFWKQASRQTGRLREAALSYKTLLLEGGNAPAANRILASFTEDEQAYALLNTHFKIEAKRLNPFYRGRQIATIVSEIRREMVSHLGVENTGPGGEPIKLTAGKKAQIDEALSEYARREIRNTLIAQQAPGWTGKRRIDVEKTLDMIGALSPDVREEIDRRLAKAKVYSAETVFEYWPEVKDRLLRDREDAFLSDIVSIAKVMK